MQSPAPLYLHSTLLPLIYSNICKNNENSYFKYFLHHEGQPSYEWQQSSFHGDRDSCTVLSSTGPIAIVRSHIIALIRIIMGIFIG